MGFGYDDGTFHLCACTTSLWDPMSKRHVLMLFWARLSVRHE